MRNNGCGVAAIAIVAGLAAGAVACTAEPLEERIGIATKPIVGGTLVGQCGFPTVASLGGCTATLVHPQVLVTAEHCGSPRVAEFGETAGRAPIRRAIRCFPVPQTGRRGADTSFCLLSEPVDLPLTPILYGCEVERELRVGRQVVITGFGLTSFNNPTSGGIKRWAWTPITGLESELALVGTPEHSACPGDSGGPAFVRLEDGSWRLFGNVSGGTTGRPCNGDGAYPLVHQHVQWFEQASGIDITPCHDVDGTWNPGPDCGGFFAGDHNSVGNWNNLCAAAPVSGPGTSCGPAAGTPAPAPVCDAVPARYVGVSDGCDCPADGNTSCDPDCAVANRGGASCGCDYCYGAPSLCPAVPSQYIGVNDGCDCPMDGDVSCDPDCAIANGGQAPCGCDYCY